MINNLEIQTANAYNINNRVLGMRKIILKDMVKYYQQLEEKALEEILRYRNLWQTVILQAFLDLQIKGSNDIIKQETRLNAELWLTSYDEDFIIVCYLADLDPDYVVAKAWKIINNKAT